ncbi:hypothetical protein LHK_01336 [Laribacter hongkongensis HLHK9]|uniref:Uncharacterized protein n=1 Tax=Laribacter hongkongensis (strain HLHK9) TaxID=557598 RepID=C1D786_LARHH|nr:hypothetical protein LHK_01336 [Laribacter hongkongensis HLHK9]
MSALTVLVRPACTGMVVAVPCSHGEPFMLADEQSRACVASVTVQSIKGYSVR